MHVSIYVYPYLSISISISIYLYVCLAGASWLESSGKDCGGESNSGASMLCAMARQTDLQGGVESWTAGKTGLIVTLFSAIYGSCLTGIKLGSPDKQFKQFQARFKT